MKIKMSLLVMICNILCCLAEPDSKPDPLLSSLKNLEGVLDATKEFIESTEKLNGKKCPELDAVFDIYSAIKDFSAATFPADPYCSCRLPSHAGNLPKAVCDIVEQLKLSKINPIVKQNSYVFYGPPGTGKSTLVRALARETDSHLIELIGPTLGNSYRSSGAEKIKNAFEQVEEIWARDPQKTIVVFVDAIDACTSLPLNGYIDKYENDHRMVIIVTLNDRNVLNSALLSRLEQVEFPLPDRATCAEIFFHHLKEHAQDLGDKVYEYAEKAHAAGLSGRNIENIVGKTIREKHRRKSEKIEDQLILSLIQAEDKANKAEAAAREKEEKNDVGRQEKLKRF